MTLLGRRRETRVLIAALMLASAGVATVATLDDEPEPRRTASQATTSLPTTLPSTTTSTTAAPRVWQETENCATAEPDRPAVLDYSITGDPSDPLAYQRALRLTATVGVPQATLVRQGKERWRGFGQAGGTVGSLLGPARKLVAARSNLTWTQARLVCSHHRGTGDRLYFVLRPGVDPQQVVARSGFADVVDARQTSLSWDESYTNAIVTTFAPQAVERAIRYLEDDDVLNIGIDTGCAVGTAASSAPHVEIPALTTSTSAPSTTTTTTTTTPRHPSYSYLSPPLPPCGVEVE